LAGFPLSNSSFVTNMTDLILDLRYGVRTLLKNPGFALVATLTLALGIGANTAIFSVVNSVLLRPLPYQDPQRLVNVWTSTGKDSHDNHSAGDFLDLSDENRSLSAIAGYRSYVFTVLAGRGGEPSQLEGTYVTLEFFDVLGVQPVAGRLFSRERDRVGGEKLVVLSDSAWQQLFARGSDAVGATIRLDGEAYIVAGVLKARTEFPEGTNLWVLSSKRVPPSPLAITDPSADRDVRYFSAIARVKADVTLQQAQADLERVATGIQQRHPQTAAGRTVRIAPVYDELVEDVRWGLLVLQSAVGVVLLIACANVSSLLIARASGRRRELAVRAALGAGRQRLVRLLLTESLVLSLVGGITGLLLGAWLIGLIVRVMPETVPRANQIAIDPFVAAAALILAVVTAALFGILPAVNASRTDTATAMKESGGRGDSSRTRGRSVLVVAEIALTLVLLAGAGLLLNSFLRLRQVDSGMRPENVTILTLALPATRYTTEESQGLLYTRLLDSLSNRPGIQAVGLGFPGPLRGSNASGSFFIEGRPSIDRSDRPTANMGSVSGGFFEAMGIPLVAGRTFAESDGPKDAGVAIVNVAMAQKYWPGENAIGKRLRFESDANTPWITIVGIVGDVRQLGLERSAPPILYIPYRQFALPFTNVAVRSRAPAGTVSAMLRSALSSADPELPFGEISTLQDALDRAVDLPRFRMTLLASFATAALILAAVGIYGLVSYTVASRTREFGIRLALGAQPSQVLGSVMREGLGLAVAGIGIGLGAAFLAVRLIASFLFGVGAGDPATFAAVAALLLVVALAACYVPSRRALRVDPIAALRAD
jgi:putative ABC transport system permease protein